MAWVIGEEKASHLHAPLHPPSDDYVHSRHLEQRVSRHVCLFSRLQFGPIFAITEFSNYTSTKLFHYYYNGMIHLTFRFVTEINNARDEERTSEMLSQYLLNVLWVWIVLEDLNVELHVYYKNMHLEYSRQTEVKDQSSLIMLAWHIIFEHYLNV